MLRTSPSKVALDSSRGDSSFLPLVRSTPAAKICKFLNYLLGSVKVQSDTAVTIAEKSSPSTYSSPSSPFSPALAADGTEPLCGLADASSETFPKQELKASSSHQITIQISPIITFTQSLSNSFKRL